VTGPETSVIRKIIDNKFKSEGLPEPSLAAEVGSVEWCKNLVENGKGLSFALVKDIQKEINEKALRIVPLNEYVYVTAEAVTRKDMQNPIIKKFIEMVKQAFNYTDTKQDTLPETDNTMSG
jgi:DNA-binding transcriptional LysR family regulator